MTSTVPALPAGAVAVTCVAELTVIELAAVPPKETPLAPVKLVPGDGHGGARGGRSCLTGLTAVTVGVPS